MQQHERMAKSLHKNVFDGIAPAQLPSAWRGGVDAASSIQEGAQKNAAQKQAESASLIPSPLLVNLAEFLLLYTSRR